MSEDKVYPLEEALKAQGALRAAAGLAAEQFPVASFVGMVSDEIEILRSQGRSDAQIAEVIRAGSAVEVTPDEIAAHYAPPELRHGYGD